MTTLSNNPAGRLNDLITKMRGVRTEKNLNNQRKNVTVAEAWSEILAIEIDDRSVLLSRLSRVVRLPQQVQDAVRAQESLDPNLYLEWVGPVQQALSVMNLDSPWKGVIAHLDPAKLRSLVFCSDQLSKINPESVSDPKHLEELNSLVNQSIDSLIQNTSLPDYLRVFMLEKLYLLEAAIIDYQFLGASPLVEVFESTVGACALNPNLYTYSCQDGSGQSFWDSMSKLHIVVSLLGNGQRLLVSSAKPITHFLESFLP